ncbi:MAG: PorP/SprF family type IX secretion system membrane protein [Saprospiraceae bacterium]|nr:PorP/SprF family type IX secretion system membrane protein [Saprospiraceae bacterium]
MYGRSPKLCCICILMFVGLIVLKGQDPIYSQFYNAHLQMNPALAGNTMGPLVQLNYRNQWPALQSIYTTYSLSYDQYIDKLKSGIGVMLLSDNAGNGTLQSTGLTAFYSYKLKVNNETYIKGGMEAGFYNLSLDWNKLQFGDAIDPRNGPVSPTGIPYPSSEIPPTGNSKNFLTVGAGVVLYNPAFYVGLSLKNLNTPNISFVGNSATNDNSNNTLPTRISLHAGSQILLKKGNNKVDPTFISPNIVFLRQSGYNQLNLGAYLSVDKIQGGVWFRHSFYNGDALIASLGVKKSSLK